jgi:hypothetical protein
MRAVVVIAFPRSFLDQCVTSPVRPKKKKTLLPLKKDNEWKICTRDRR